MLLTRCGGLQGQLWILGVEGSGCKCDNGLPSKAMRSYMTMGGYSSEVGIQGCRGLISVWTLHAFCRIKNAAAILVEARFPFIPIPL